MPGSGLGLAIVKQVAEAHGGSVSATEVPGGGAAVGFVLPTDGALAVVHEAKRRSHLGDLGRIDGGPHRVNRTGRRFGERFAERVENPRIAGVSKTVTSS